MTSSQQHWWSARSGSCLLEERIQHERWKIALRDKDLFQAKVHLRDTQTGSSGVVLVLQMGLVPGFLSYCCPSRFCLNLIVPRVPYLMGLLEFVCSQVFCKISFLGVVSNLTAFPPSCFVQLWWLFLALHPLFPMFIQAWSVVHFALLLSTNSPTLTFSG